MLTILSQVSNVILNAPVDDAGWNFNWGIHIISIPLTVALGVMIGWAMRDRKAAEDEARRELAQRDAAKSEKSA